jgi:hypothetical protein
MFKGSLVALITPMRSDGSVDEKAYAEFVDWQIKEGTDAVVPVGTTGESPTLSHDEHKRVVEIAIEVAKGRVPVIAGAGSNSTEEAIDLARHAKMAGADATLIVTPYYNKPTQEGMYLHFKAIADTVDLPMIIYNIPPRSVVDMSVETMARLAKHRNIVGVKDATANLVRPAHEARLRRRVLPVVGRGSHGDCVPGRGRRRLHQRHGERRAAAVRGHAGRLAGGTRQGSDGDPASAGPAARRAVRGDQSGTGEVCRVIAGEDLRALPPAACADHGGHAGEGAQRDDRRRSVELIIWLESAAPAHP